MQNQFTNGNVQIDHIEKESLLKGALRCHHCREIFQTIPKLKKHLEETRENHLEETREKE